MEGDTASPSTFLPVEGLMGKRVNGQGETEYLVKWKGAPQSSFSR